VAHQPVELLSNPLPKAENFFNSARIFWMLSAIEAQCGLDLRWNRDEIADGLDGSGLAANQNEEATSLVAWSETSAQPLDAPSRIRAGSLGLDLRDGCPLESLQASSRNDHSLARFADRAGLLLLAGPTPWRSACFLFPRLSHSERRQIASGSRPGFQSRASRRILTCHARDRHGRGTKRL
jgi:hypothetical protein